MLVGFGEPQVVVDWRVIRHAATLRGAGYDVHVIAVPGKGLPNVEERDGYTVYRVSNVLTWRDGFPRTAALLGFRRRPGLGPERRARRTPSGPTPHTPAGGISGSQWMRWILTGREPAPPSWHGETPGLVRRIAFALSLARRVTTRLPDPVREAGRRIRKTDRRVRSRASYRLVRPTRYRQVDRRMADVAISLQPDVCWANDADTLRGAYAAARATGARLVYDA